MKQWLFNATDPWEDVVSEWKKSSPYRLNEIRHDADVSKTIEKWPRYRDPQGFELVISISETFCRKSYFF